MSRLDQDRFHDVNGLDSMLVSSREGVTWLYYEDQKWKREVITTGEPKKPHQSPDSESPGSGDHWGSGGADAGSFGGDPFAYIATIDPFHGTAACVYTKTGRGMKNQKWKRHVLDYYGTPTQQLKNGDGPGHFVVCGDFDDDGNDEFLVSLFGSVDRNSSGEVLPAGSGPNPNKGIIYYKPLDLENGVFSKWRITEDSAARIALGDFSGRGLTDLVSIKYNVTRYYEEPNPVVRLYKNAFSKGKSLKTEPAIITTVWDEEGMVYLRDPANDVSLTIPASTTLLEIGNYSISSEIYPKGHRISFPAGHGVKVLYGAIEFYCQEAAGEAQPSEASVETWSPFSVAPFTASSTIPSHKSAFASKVTGAIILRLVPISTPSTFPTADEVPVKTELDTASLGVHLDPLEFKQVDKLWWGNGNPFFKNVDFHNLTGIHFRFLRSKKPIAHMQFWTPGTGVNCGVHNHSSDMFAEIHISLSAGTNTGGMSRLKKEFEKTPPEELNNLGEKAFDHLELKPLEEHGGMWERDPYGNPVRGENNVVKYPWHKWQAGKGPDVDLWLALEFYVD